MRKRIAIYTYGNIHKNIRELAERLDFNNSDEYEIVIVSPIYKNSTLKDINVPVINLNVITEKRLNKKSTLSKLSLRRIYNKYLCVLNKYVKNTSKRSSKISQIKKKEDYKEEVISLKKVLAQYEFDIIIACSPGYVAKILSAKAYKNSSCIAWLPNKYEKYFSKELGDSEAYKKIMKKNINKIHYHVTQTIELKNKYDEIFKINTLVIPNAIRVGNLSHQEPKSNIKNVAFIDTIKDKNSKAADVVRALEILRKDNMKLFFLNATKEEFQKNTQYPIKPLKHDNILFGKVEEFDADSFENIDCLIVTSDSVGLPQAILQAMARGVIVITYPLDKNSDLLIPNYNCLMAKKTSYVKLAERIALLNIDPTIIEEISSNAYEFSKNFRMNNVSERWIEIFKEC